MNIVVDAMGSDTAPGPDVEGAVLAAQETHHTIILVGDKQQINNELAKFSTQHLSIDVVHAEQRITMHDQPSQVIRNKNKSSMHIGMALVHDGHADAFVTAGNTGATLAIAMLSTLHLIPHIKRPALTAIFPNLTGHTIAADIGANTDCHPEYLLQFAQMANIYATSVMQIQTPRIALLSNGEEESKGNNLIKETTKLLNNHPNLHFIGNAEPKATIEGHTDIIIHDGFTGNIFIKSIEATADMLLQLLKEKTTSSPLTSLGGLLIKPALRQILKQIDPFEIGGAPLLGVNGVVIIGHGRSNAKAIKNAIHQAEHAVNANIIATITESI
jgi:glycerol-3-phosphate acyltransferase PlsX